MDCIFCQIVQGKQKADVVYGNDKLIAFKDINPKANVHLLVVSKKHITSVNELENKDKGTVGEMVLAAKSLAKEFGIDQSGYRLVFNVGRGGGQIVDHLHLHLLGGGFLNNGQPGFTDN
jgi:histidine triad (HIT) family protein